MKSFENWKYEEVELTFGIKQNEHLALMAEWLTTEATIEEDEKKTIIRLQKRLKRFANAWNEEDLKVFFVIPLIDVVDFYAEGRYRAFTEAMISAKIKDIHQKDLDLKGRVEFLVATGEQDPRTPFFFLNEYKPQLKSQNDPQGQLMIAMLVAQAKNESFDIPIFGLYTIGRFWFFVVLQAKEYAVSRAFDATEDDVWQIVKILKKVKLYIEENYQKTIKANAGFV
ncbi:MAG: hypothetical protein MUE85_09085 [Microscillaceae bacterium]|jgi:hypothetical protein|nr:hypothetical protein [Microscillaceae bacterium]